MSLETLLEKMIASLDRNSAIREKEFAANGAAAPAAAPAAALVNKTSVKEAKKKTAEPVAAVTFDALKVAMVKVKERHGLAFSKKMIERVGNAKELAGVPPEMFTALIAEAEKSLSEPLEEDDEDEEDL